MQLAQPLLAAAQGSSIVMISSVAGGPASISSGTLYAMTKGGSCHWLPASSECLECLHAVRCHYCL